MRSPGRAAVAVALVPFGTVAGHVGGSWLAGEPALLDAGHGHLRPTVWLALGAATVAVALVGIRPGGSRWAPRLSWLLPGQVAVFLGLEATEHLLAGHGAPGLVADPSLQWGLVAQLATAALLVLIAALARASGERVRALLSRPPARGRVPAARPWRLQPGAVRSVHLASPASERGPPRVLLIA